MYLWYMRKRYPEFTEHLVADMGSERDTAIGFTEDHRAYRIRVDEELTECHVYCGNDRDTWHYVLSVDEPLTFERVEEIARALNVDPPTAARIAFIMSIMRGCAKEVRRNWLKLKKM